MRFLVLLLLLWTSAQAQSSVLAPWKFGMTKAEVTAFEQFAPFKDVQTTGGVETFNAIFDGKKANISFLFDQSGLKRIQVWAYEGGNKEEAMKAWASLYSFLTKSFGTVEVPEINTESKNATLPPEVLAIAATVNAGVTGKTQMAPQKMPLDAKIFSSLFAREIKGGTYFYLFLYYDRP